MDVEADICYLWMHMSEGTFFHLSPRLYNFFLHAQFRWTKFVMLIYLEFLTIANSFLLNIAEHEIFSANKYENANFHIY